MLAEAQAIARDRRDDFAPARITPPRPGFRASNILYDCSFPDLCGRFNAMMLPILPPVLALLGLPAMSHCKFELQMTAHHNGDFFKRHQDNGTDNTRFRVLSFVCYFRLTPEQMFRGGDLVLYGADNRSVRIAPDHNSCVFFPADLPHEVLPVDYGGDRWADGRFSLNGWVNRVQT